MNTITWIPGTNNDLDAQFDNLRVKQYENKNHRLWKNYSKESFQSAIALTICYNDNNEVEMCSSIASKKCWPDGTYRILNRLWKSNNKIIYPKIMSLSFAESAKSQILWLQKNTNCKLYFISRQTNHWEEFGIKNFAYYNMEFKKDKYFYLTCPNELDSSCWQKIIYFGDENILAQWKRRSSNQ